MDNAEYTREVLRTFADADLYEDLLWRVRGDEVVFAVNCSDVFMWATADAEPIEPTDLPLLREALDDLNGLDSEFYLCELFAARKRGMRPMRLFLQAAEDPVAVLFRACGPERDRATEG